MKDKIFIIWSGENKIALKLKKILEEKYNYLCFVGGNYQNDSQMLSMGDTIVRQMRMCNQSIVIFSNKCDGRISNNLYFELGFVSASYGMKKVHCVKKHDELISLPSDFDNSFVQNINANDESEFVDGIVEYFLSRQKLSVDTNKMYLINNRYIIHEMLQVHYSDVGSKCSDYELAQYVLFYMQSGVMFQDECRILEELKNFKRQFVSEFSHELHQSINLSIAFLEATSVLSYENDSVYITDDLFRNYFISCKNMISEIKVDESGTFDNWAKMILAENLAYVTSLYASNPHITEGLKEQLLSKVIEYAKLGIVYIEELQGISSCIENNDTVGLLSLFKAYLYKHLYYSYKKNNPIEAEKWLLLSLKENQSLLQIFNTNSVDSKIYNNLEMDYYIILSEYINFQRKDNIDEFERMMYISDIDNFIKRFKTERDVNAYIHKLSEYRKHLS